MATFSILLSIALGGALVMLCRMWLALRTTRSELDIEKAKPERIDIGVKVKTPDWKYETVDIRKWVKGYNWAKMPPAGDWIEKIMVVRCRRVEVPLIGSFSTAPVFQYQYCIGGIESDWIQEWEWWMLRKHAELIIVATMEAVHELKKSNNC